MYLLLSDDTQFGIRVCENLLARGLFSYRAELDCGRALCESLDTSGIFLDGRQRPAFAELLCRELLALYPELPILFLCAEHTVTDCRSASLLPADSLDGETLTNRLLSFARERCGWSAKLSTYALTLSDDPQQTRFLGYRLHLTPREHAILGFLFYCAPKTLPPHLILSVCFPRGTEKAENLGVHISAINRKSLSLTGIPLIENRYGEGYRIHARVFSVESAGKF